MAPACSEVFLMSRHRAIEPGSIYYMDFDRPRTWRIDCTPLSSLRSTLVNSRIFMRARDVTRSVRQSLCCCIDLVKLIREVRRIQEGPQIEAYSRHKSCKEQYEEQLNGCHLGYRIPTKSVANKYPKRKFSGNGVNTHRMIRWRYSRHLVSVSSVLKEKKFHFRCNLIMIRHESFRHPFPHT